MIRSYSKGKLEQLTIPGGGVIEKATIGSNLSSRVRFYIMYIFISIDISLIDTMIIQSKWDLSRDYTSRPRLWLTAVFRSRSSSNHVKPRLLQTPSIDCIIVLSKMGKIISYLYHTQISFGEAGVLDIKISNLTKTGRRAWQNITKKDE